MTICLAFAAGVLVGVVVHMLPMLGRTRSVERIPLTVERRQMFNTREYDK